MIKVLGKCKCSKDKECIEVKKLKEEPKLAQSLVVGAMHVNAWNITKVAAPIGDALNMIAEEQEERHHRNFEHVTTHTAQVWAETFFSELNDLRVQAWDMLQRLWIGPISNATVDVSQGSISMEVCTIGVSKGTTIDPILGEIIYGNARQHQ